MVEEDIVFLQKLIFGPWTKQDFQTCFPFSSLLLKPGELCMGLWLQAELHMKLTKDTCLGQCKATGSTISDIQNSALL